MEDMDTLLKDIPLGEVSTSMTINATAAILLAFYTMVAENKGVNISSLRGTVQNDILKEYISRGTHIFPPEQSLRIVTDIFEYCHHQMPKWNTISISGYHIREAGLPQPRSWLLPSQTELPTSKRPLTEAWM